MVIDVNAIIDWAISNWALVAAIAGGIVLLWVLLKVVAGNIKMSHHKEFPTEGAEANRLALGLQQLTNSSQYWNDPTASLLVGAQREMLQEMWGLNSTQDAYDTIERLTGVRRRRDLWQQLLAIRAEVATSTGIQRPTHKQWLKAIKDAGGSGRGEERDFVGAVHYYEDEFGNITDKSLFGKKAPAVVNFDGYALGQAVAVAVWAVAMGYFTREQSAEAIKRINDIARSEFGSWADFGRSYAIGKVMHWSEGQMSEKAANKFNDGAYSMASALSAKKSGPWAALSWRV